jgi:hypothetical protein
MSESGRLLNGAKVIPDSCGRVGPETVRYIDGHGDVRETVIHRGLVSIDWHGKRRQYVAGLMGVDADGRA